MRKDILFYIFSFLSNLVLLILVFASLNPAGLDVYFNSDTLYLPSLYRDLFIDKTGICGWHLNPAPNFFPDMVLYFLIRSVTSDFIMASFTFSVIQYLGFTILIYFLNVSVYGKPHFTALFFVHICLNMIFLVSIFNSDVAYTAYLLLNSYHMGAFMLALMGYVLAFRFLKQSSNKYLIWIGILSFLGILSDKLFIVLFMIPILFWIILLKEPTTRKSILKLVSLLIFVFLFSILALKLMQQWACFSIGRPHRMLDFDNIPNALHTFLNQTWISITDLNLKTFILLCTALAFLIAFQRILPWIRSRDQNLLKERGPRLMWIFAFLTFFFIPIVLFAPVVNGNYTGFDSLRYNIYAYIWGLIAFGFFIGTTPFKFIHVARGGLFIITLVLLTFIFIRSLKSDASGLHTFCSYYPERVQHIDSLARESNLKYGLANYWDAKLITMFSRENVRTYAVFDDLTPYYHVANTHWFCGGEGAHSDPEFTFIITDKFEGLNQIPSQLLENSEHINIRGLEILFIPAIKYSKGSLEPYEIDMTKQK